MTFIRKLTIHLMVVAPFVVAVYCFIVNQWAAGFGATVLCFASAVLIGFGTELTKRYGEDYAKRVRDQERERLRSRL